MFSFARAKGYIAIAFFFSLVIIGVMFFLNIFLAILLENFGSDNELMTDNNANKKEISILEKIKLYFKTKFPSINKAEKG
jgi:hypothetical protein